MKIEVIRKAASGASNAFSIMQPDAGTAPSADSTTDTLTFTSSDASVTITGNSGTDTLDFTGAGATVTLDQARANGNTLTAPVFFAAGTAALPGIATSGDVDTGVYFPSADTLCLTAGGFNGLEVGKSTGSVSNVGLGQSASTNDSYPVIVARTQSAATYVNVANNSTNLSARSSFLASNGIYDGQFGQFGTGPSTTHAYDRRTFIEAGASSEGVSIITKVAGKSVRIYAGGRAVGNMVAEFNDDLTTDFGGDIFATNTDAHLADATIHFTQAAISIPASQISDFDTEVSNNISVAANTAKVTNATHTGEVTGGTTLTIDPTAISNKAVVIAAPTDNVLIEDATDGALKQVTAQSIADLGGDVLGPVTATDNALARWNTTTGELLQDSVVIDDDSTISAVNRALNLSGVTGATPTSGAGTRMMWIPAKAAFRAGNVSGTEWDDASIGSKSAALGENNTASGTSTFTAGNDNMISGTGSVGIGDTNTVTVSSAYALGKDNTVTSGIGNLAVGVLNSVTGAGSALAVGASNTVTGAFGIVVGNDNTVSGAGSAVLGNDNQPTGPGSFILGDANVNGGTGTFAIGSSNTPSGTSSICIGLENLCSGNRAMAIGRWTNNAFGNSIVIGRGVSLAAPLANTAAQSIAMGMGTDIPTFIITKGSGAGTFGQVQIPNDNGLLVFGTGQNATISYDGANMIINPKLVGTGVLSITGDISLLDEDMILSATTGTKFGTASTQKLSLWGATPAVQPSSVGENTGYTAVGGTNVNHQDTFTGNVGTKAYTINDIVKHLKNTGVIAAS